MQKLVCTDEFAKPLWLKSLGDYNELPTPYREIDRNEYFRLQLSSIGHIDFRQVKLSDERYYKNTRLFFYYDCVLAVVYPVDWVLEGGKLVYKDDVRYFCCGCEHDYEELGLEECVEKGIKHFGSCYHVYKCKKCGNVYSQDSSD